MPSLDTISVDTVPLDPLLSKNVNSKEPDQESIETHSRNSNGNGGMVSSHQPPSQPSSNTSAPFPLKTCQALLSTLRSHPSAYPFLKPVSTTLVPDYLTIIKNPIDLGTIGTRVTSSYYSHVMDFLNDLELMFDNCDKYNGRESIIGMEGQKLKKLFLNLTKDTLPNWVTGLKCWEIEGPGTEMGPGRRHIRAPKVYEPEGIVNESTSTSSSSTTLSNTTTSTSSSAHHSARKSRGNSRKSSRAASPTLKESIHSNSSSVQSSSSKKSKPTTTKNSTEDYVKKPNKSIRPSSSNSSSSSSSASASLVKLSTTTTTTTLATTTTTTGITNFSDSEVSLTDSEDDSNDGIGTSQIMKKKKYHDSLSSTPSEIGGDFSGQIAMLSNSLAIVTQQLEVLTRKKKRKRKNSSKSSSSHTEKKSKKSEGT